MVNETAIYHAISLRTNATSDKPTRFAQLEHRKHNKKDRHIMGKERRHDQEDR